MDNDQQWTAVCLVLPVHCIELHTVPNPVSVIVNSFSSIRKSRPDKYTYMCIPLYLILEVTFYKQYTRGSESCCFLQLFTSVVFSTTYRSSSTLSFSSGWASTCIGSMPTWKTYIVIFQNKCSNMDKAYFKSRSDMPYSFNGSVMIRARTVFKLV